MIDQTGPVAVSQHPENVLLEQEWLTSHYDATTGKFKLSTPLARFPLEILDLGSSLRHLDLSNTNISSLPDEFGPQLSQLRVAFFSQCHFKVFPRQLATCANLEMVAFRGNGMEQIPDDSLPANLRWLILTDNRIGALPATIGKCARLEKCMLSGNRLEALPVEMAQCRKLGLLRLSANMLRQVPSWLFDMPELAFLSLGGNPCFGGAGAGLASGKDKLADVEWDDIRVEHVLGEGASGTISKARWQDQDVAIKLFRFNITSDGTPQDEMAACVRAGRHGHIIDTLARIQNHADNKQGLVMQLVPETYYSLGLPPSFDSCTRDCFDSGTRLSVTQATRILQGMASAAAHLHGRGIAHGDLYAHNILMDDQGHALLGDFGAATIYGEAAAAAAAAAGQNRFEQMEVLAFAHLIEDLVGLTTTPEEEAEWVRSMQSLGQRCGLTRVEKRPRFGEICSELEASMAKVMMDGSCTSDTNSTCYLGNGNEN